MNIEFANFAFYLQIIFVKFSYIFFKYFANCVFYYFFKYRNLRILKIIVNKLQTFS